MKRILVIAATFAVAVFVSVGAARADGGCTTVTTSKGNTRTVAVVNPGTFTGTLTTDCQIGVYFSEAGAVTGASISGATHYGIYVDGAAVDVTDSQVSDIGDHPFTGGQHGNAIYYWNGASGTVSGNQIPSYQKGGIVINGAGTSATVTHNTLGADNPDPVSYIAKNGIQFGYGATGAANNNSVTGNWYTGANWASTGILVFESNGVSVAHNDVTNSQTGIDAETWCYFGVPSASDNSFADNTVTGSDYGMQVAAFSLTPYSTCDAVADNNKITNNIISSTAGDTGIWVGAYVYFGSYTPEAVNNKVVHNTISGFETVTDLGDAGPHTVVEANATP